MHTQSFKQVEFLLKPLLAVSCSLVLCSLLLRSVLAPSVVKAIQLSQASTALSEKSGQGRGYAAVHDELVHQTTALSAKVKQLESQLPAAGQSLSEMIQFVYDRAWQSCGDKLSFERTSIEGKINLDGNAGTNVLFEITGSYRCLSRLLAALEQTPHLVRIQTIGIETAPEGELRIRMLCTLFTALK